MLMLAFDILHEDASENLDLKTKSRTKQKQTNKKPIILPRTLENSKLPKHG